MTGKDVAIGPLEKLNERWAISFNPISNRYDVRYFTSNATWTLAQVETYGEALDYIALKDPSARRDTVYAIEDPIPETITIPAPSPIPDHYGNW